MAWRGEDWKENLAWHFISQSQLTTVLLVSGYNGEWDGDCKKLFPSPFVQLFKPISFDGTQCPFVLVFLTYSNEQVGQWEYSWEQPVLSKYYDIIFNPVPEPCYARCCTISEPKDGPCLKEFTIYWRIWMANKYTMSNCEYLHWRSDHWELWLIHSGNRKHETYVSYQISLNVKYPQQTAHNRQRIIGRNYSVNHFEWIKLEKNCTPPTGSWQREGKKRWHSLNQLFLVNCLLGCTI